MRSSYQCGKLCDAVGVSVDEEESERFGLFFLADNGTQAAYHPDVLNQYEETGHGSVHEVSLYQNVSYHYLGDTRLARVSLSPAGLVYELGYDALGRCVRRTSNGVSTYYIYDGERPIIEFDAVGTITARNTYGMGMDEILARDSGTPLYYHQDRLGNVSAVTNGVGQVVEQYRYDAFGQPEIRGGPVPGNANGALTGTAGNNVTQVNNRFLFNGREWAAAYGFYEYRNRAYNPALGRFMSEDPMGFKAGDRNLFRYCGGDPVNRTDPMGLDYGPFDSPDQAFRFFDAKYNNASIHENVEYRVEIYQGTRTGKFYTTAGVAGSRDHVDRAPIGVKHSKYIGPAHTHGDYSVGYVDRYTGKQVVLGRAARPALDSFKSQEPSIRDRETAERFMVYTSTPARTGWRQRPGDTHPQSIPTRDKNDSQVESYKPLDAKEIEKKEQGAPGPALDGSELGGSAPPIHRGPN